MDWNKTGAVPMRVKAGRGEVTPDRPESGALTVEDVVVDVIERGETNGPLGSVDVVVVVEDGCVG